MYMSHTEQTWDVRTINAYVLPYLFVAHVNFLTDNLLQLCSGSHDVLTVACALSAYT